MPRPPSAGSTRRRRSSRLAAAASAAATDATTTYSHSHAHKTPESPRTKVTPEKRPAMPPPPSDLLPPSPLTPKYGRSRGSLGSSRRRLSALLASPRGLDGSVFDDLIDGFSPIKRGPPAESIEHMAMVPLELGVDDAHVRTHADEEQSEDEKEDNDSDNDNDNDSDNDSDNVNDNNANGDSASSSSAEDIADDSAFDIDNIVGLRAAKRRRIAASPPGLLERRGAGASLPARNRTLKAPTTSIPRNSKNVRRTATASAHLKSKPKSNPVSKPKKAPAPSNPKLKALEHAAKPNPGAAACFDDIDDYQLAEEAV
ncbi:hypothetical protein GGI07_001156 [Coemansia sp. Benny D115]|nr:hypothetical protein GGI07_001156 [Coemansia sp. Benny D115]